MKDNVEIFAHDTSETGIANNYVVHDFRNDQRFRGKNQLKGIFREIAHSAKTLKEFCHSTQNISSNHTSYTYI